MSKFTGVSVSGAGLESWCIYVRENSCFGAPFNLKSSPKTYRKDM